MAHFTLGHWGVMEVERDAAGLPVLRPWRRDPDATAIGVDQLSSEVSAMRIERPSIRRSWLEEGPGARTDRRGSDPFVEVSWDEALRLLADDLDRVVSGHGNEAIFGGSYGWASAGRFHHAQSQLHRFMNCIGGCVRSRDSYSHGAANVVMPHIVGPLDRLLDQRTGWDVMERHTELFVAFGGVPLKNGRMTSGGAGTHSLRRSLLAIRDGGTRFVNVSPQRTDFDAFDVEWIPIRPNTDTALMLAMMHILFTEGLHDRGFLERCCTGAGELLGYLDGSSDGVLKDALWAEGITGVPRTRIRGLAIEARSARTMLNGS